MYLTELIKQSQKLLIDHGNLEVLDTDHYSIAKISYEEFEEAVPEWNINKRDKFAYIKSNR